MKIKVQKSLVTYIFLVFLSITAAGCDERDQELLVDLLSQIVVSEIKEVVNEAIEMLPIPKKTEMSDVLPSVIEITMPEISFGDLLHPAPFGMPTTGYTGWKYKDPITGGNHKGIDIWASQSTDNGGKRGNPVFAVFEGTLYKSGSGVRIIHPELDRNKWMNLPDYQVSTYYGHLVDMPPKIAKLETICPQKTIRVRQGELLGYMDPVLKPDYSSVHLHFSVTRMDPENPKCWVDERKSKGTYDPFIYLGLNENDYSNKKGNRSEFPGVPFSLNISDVLEEITQQ